VSIRVTTLVWDEAKDIKQTDLLALLSLADQANDQGVCWPSLSTIARRIRLSDIRSTRKVIVRLVKSGWVRRHQRMGRSTIYQITPHGEALEGAEEALRGMLGEGYVEFPDEHFEDEVDETPVPQDPLSQRTPPVPQDTVPQDTPGLTGPGGEVPRARGPRSPGPSITVREPSEESSSPTSTQEVATQTLKERMDEVRRTGGPVTQFLPEIAETLGWAPSLPDLIRAEKQWGWATGGWRAVEIARDHVMHCRKKGYSPNVDGWWRAMDYENTDRERRTRGRAYAPNGVPL
jgi:DNA-binding MarR family transcriptional regulator